MFCNSCGTCIIDENAKFCHKCGAPLKESFRIKAAKCPNCNASIPYGDNIEKVSCNFCGTDFVIADEAAKMNRILRAKSDAKKRDAQTQIEYEEYKTKLELKKEKVKFFTTNGLKLILIVLCIIYILYRIATKEIIGFDFIMMLIVFKVFIMPRNENKK